MITKESIEAAHERIKPFIHKTPVLTSKSSRERLRQAGGGEQTPANWQVKEQAGLPKL